jgi:hypothetical protein
MKTTVKFLSKKLMVIGALLLFSGSLLIPPAQAQDEERRTGFSISLSAGIFYPQQRSFRLIYGTVQIPLGIQLGCAFSRRVALHLGFKYLSFSGNTIVIGPIFIPETYSVRFKNSSVRLGFTYALRSRKRLTMFVGGGGSTNFFKEKWEGLSLSREGRKVGFYILTGNEYSLGKRFSLFSLLEYTNVATGTGSKLLEKVNLGGLELSFGLRFWL